MNTNNKTQRTSKGIAATLAAVATLSPMAARSVTVAGLALGALAMTAPKAHAQLRPGWYDLGNGYTVAVFNSGDARAYADTLTQTSNFQDKLNKIAQLLIKIGMGDNKAWQVARVICYNGLSWALRAQIYWCSWRSGTVYVYHRWSIPFWADPA